MTMSPQCLLESIRAGVKL